MVNTLINILDADRRRAVENIREAAGRIWARPLHRYFTDHTVAHTERIIALMDGLTAGMMATAKRLLPTEILVLLSAAYLHDIGMQNEKFAEGDLVEIRARHNEQTAEMIYRVFEDPANAFAIPLARDPGWVEAVALVAKGHRGVKLESDEYASIVHGGETLRVRLLAALLRFGDELDIDHRRVDLELMKLLKLPEDSQLHWWKCHYVSGVSIVDEYIKIAYRIPQDRPDYEGLIVPLVETEIRAKLASLEEIFRANAIKVAIAKSEVRPMRLVQRMPPEVEAQARGYVDQRRGGEPVTQPPKPVEPVPHKPLRIFQVQMADRHAEGGRVPPPLEQFPAGTREVFLVFRYANMPLGQSLSANVYDSMSRLVSEWSKCYEDGEPARVNSCLLPAYAGEFPPGDYRVEIRAGDQLVGESHFTVQVPQTEIVARRARLPDYKQQALEERRAALLEDYKAANAQLIRALSDVERVRIQRQVNDLERQIQAIENELSRSITPPST